MPSIFITMKLSIDIHYSVVPSHKGTIMLPTIANRLPTPAQHAMQRIRSAIRRHIPAPAAKGYTKFEIDSVLSELTDIYGINALDICVCGTGSLVLHDIIPNCAELHVALSPPQFDRMAEYLGRESGYKLLSKPHSFVLNGVHFIRTMPAMAVRINAEDPYYCTSMERELQQCQIYGRTADAALIHAWFKEGE